MDDAGTDSKPAFPTDRDVSAVIEEFGGDAREAIRALLHDIAVLAADYEQSVSRGYVRGKGLQRRAVVRLATADRP